MPRRTLKIIVVLAALGSVALGTATAGQRPNHPTTSKPSASAQGVVRVATAVYGGGRSSVCFSDQFLALVDRETDAHVQRTFARVKLTDEKLFDYPFLVMSGTGRFTLTRTEKHRLKAYIEHGGFVLASAGCSNAAWIDHFTALMKDLFGKRAFKPIKLNHPLFHTLYEVKRIQATKATRRTALYGVSLKGRLSVVFSPLGLNDTADAAKGCCCCGGNEIRNARLINANALVYALTH